MSYDTLTQAIKHILGTNSTYVYNYEMLQQADNYHHIDPYGNTVLIPREPSIKMNLTLTTTKEAVYELQELINEPKMNKIQTQAAALHAVKQHDFIVGSVDSNGFFSVAQNPSVHTTAADARTECKRLARLTPGKAFVFLTMSGAEMVPVQTISI